MLAALSRQTTQGECAVEDGLLDTTMEGMDQAKFRVPWRVRQNTDFAGRPLPHLHCVGAIVEGLVGA